jgi:hypothetical protein
VVSAQLTGGDELARMRVVPDDGRELIEARFRLGRLWSELDLGRCSRFGAGFARIGPQADFFHNS